MKLCDYLFQTASACLPQIILNIVQYSVILMHGFSLFIHMDGFSCYWYIHAICFVLWLLSRSHLWDYACWYTFLLLHRIPLYYLLTLVGTMSTWAFFFYYNQSSCWPLLSASNFWFSLTSSFSSVVVPYFLLFWSD